MKTWKELLGDAIPADLGKEIDVFETEIQLRKQGKIDEKVFAETRLRRALPRREIPRESWLLFFDDALADEWVGIHEDAPPPPRS